MCRIAMRRYDTSNYSWSMISNICAAVTTLGVLGKCLRFPVTRKASSLPSVTS